MKHENRQDETKNDREHEYDIEDLAQFLPVVNFKGSGMSLMTGPDGCAAKRRYPEDLRGEDFKLNDLNPITHVFYGKSI